MLKIDETKLTRIYRVSITRTYYTLGLKMKKDIGAILFPPIGFLRVNPRELDPLATPRGWGEKEKESHSGKILIPARYENAPPAGFDACSCVILISRTRRRNARPFVSEIVQKGRRSDDVNCARPALATLHVPRSIPRFNPSLLTPGSAFAATLLPRHS